MEELGHYRGTYTSELLSHLINMSVADAYLSPRHEGDEYLLGMVTQRG